VVDGDAGDVGAVELDGDLLQLCINWLKLTTEKAVPAPKNTRRESLLTADSIEILYITGSGIS